MGRVDGLAAIDSGLYLPCDARGFMFLVVDGCRGRDVPERRLGMFDPFS